jgi:hypothetical protein
MLACLLDDVDDGDVDDDVKKREVGVEKRKDHVLLFLGFASVASSSIITTTKGFSLLFLARACLSRVSIIQVVRHRCSTYAA